MGSDHEENLTPTATATAAASEMVGAAEPVAATLGRYRIEREIGAGAMGVVHAAFDPNLERRIALKVLRGTATFEARDRLLREARAMARLTHPNVVTVYEVSSVEGRDFIAMELIHGETLADWLRKAGRMPAAILDAFLAAGRGLAAAHAACIVHRDFKPHNVLRSRAGRIVVTDFGLAREAESQVPALDTTLVGTGSRPPSALAGITVTGSLLGTPAYMAPEQWQGGAITPATDQFAFCVALWEALSGERPYRGPTFDDLKRQVARGPAALDASRIPRRVRGLLHRGLDPDPAKRWPSMDALLTRLARARRRLGVALAIAGGALIAVVSLLFTLWPGMPPACEPPARNVATVWSPAIATELRVRTSQAHEAVLSTAFRDWQRARAAACTAPLQIQQAQLHCLDGVLARLDILRQAQLRVPDGLAEDLQSELMDPVVCSKQAPSEIPRLTLAPTPEVVGAYALLGRVRTDHHPSEAEIAAPTGASNIDPCARVVAALAFDEGFEGLAQTRAVMADAVGLAEQCGDERLRADLLIRDSPYHWELPMVGPKAEAAIQRAQTAAARVMQPELEAQLAAQKRRVARRRGEWSEAFRWIEIEIADYRGRGLQLHQMRAVISRNRLRLARLEPGDLEAAAGDIGTWRPIALAAHRPELVRQLDIHDAKVRFSAGDVASAHADLVRLWQERPRTENTPGSRRITGDVVDTGGRPVAGATVAADASLHADAIGIGLPRFVDYLPDDVQFATSDAAGHFAIDDAAPTGAIAAQLDDRRSLPVAIADRVRLVLAPTRRVSGKVDLGRTPYTRVRIYSTTVGDPTGKFSLIAPVAPDGSFELAGASVGAIRLGVSTPGNVELDEHIEYQTFPASSAPLTGVALGLAMSSRTIDVVVRSAVAATLEGALVVVFAGRPVIATADDLNRLSTTGVQSHFATQVVSQNAPRPVLDQIRPGDLAAHIEHAAQGDLTICALGFTGDWMDPDYRQRLHNHFSQLAFKCKPIGPDVAVVMVDVPPQQRFD